jgi:hypothetical protein
MLGRVSWHGGFQKCGARGGAKIEGRELRDGLTVVCEPGTCPCYRKNDDRPPEPREAHRHVKRRRDGSGASPMAPRTFLGGQKREAVYGR